MAVVGLIVAIMAVIGLVVLAGSVAALTQPQPFRAAGPALLCLLGVAAGGLLGLIGVGLYLIVPGIDPVLARRGYDSPPTILAALTAVLVLGNVLAVPALLASGSGEIARLSPTALVVAMLATQFALMGVLIWRIVRPGAITWEDMGLTAVALDRRLAQGLVGGIVIFVLAGVTGLVLRRAGIEQTQQEMFRAIRGVGQLQFLSVWLIVSIVAPICEESFFRGYVFTALRGRYGRWIAYPGSAILFAAIHFNPPAILPIMVMALCLAFLYDRTRSVVPGIIAHGLNNSVAITLLYAGLGN
jgi:hypothetical protein